MATPPYKTIKRKGGELHVWGKAPRPKVNVHPTSRRVFVPKPKPKGPAKGNPPAPVAAPAPVVPQTPVQLPLDPLYEQQMALLLRQRQTAEAAADAARQQGLAGYGYTAATGGLAFDPNNPFGKAALLKQNYDRSRRASAQTMGAGGQLYAGAFQNQQDLVNRGELQGQNALQQALASFLAQNTATRRAAGTSEALGAIQAASERQGRIKTNPAYEPTATAPDVVTATKSPFTTKLGKNKAGRAGTWHIYPDGRKVFIRS